MPTPETRPSRVWRLLVAGLLLASFVLPVHLMSGKSITNDEIAHLPAGYSYLRTGTIRLNPMHPPLVKEICALPLLSLDLELPLSRDVLERADLPVKLQWEFGRALLERPELDTILFRGRLMAVLLSFGLGVVIVLWARALWGEIGAAVAIALYALDSTITAHSQLVTTDVGVAFFSTAYLFCLRRFVLEPSAIRLSVCGVTLGLALGAKFSAVFLLPISAVLLSLAAWVEPRRPFGSNTPRALFVAAASLATMSTIAFAVLWAIYLFPPDPLFYWNGMRTVNVDHTPGYPFFLMGELNPDGWPYYLGVAWLVKTPLPTLALVAAALLAFARGARASRLEEAFLIVPALVLFGAYSALTDPIGVRYVIPCLPFVFVFTGRLALVVAGRRDARAALFAMLVLLAVEYGTIWPDHLSYFNPIAGGARGGINWLDDSNVDWGQGMIQLRDYLRRRGLRHYRICLFQNFDRGQYDIGGEWIGLAELVSPPPETLVLSAHCVARARALLDQAHGDGPENWTVHVEPTAFVGHVYYVYDLGAAPGD